MKKYYFLLLTLLLVTSTVKSQQLCFAQNSGYSSYYSRERDIVAIDWNLDGAMDYAVANYDSNLVYVHLGNPANHRDFNSVANPAAIQPVYHLMHPTQLEVANINGDAYPDLVVMFETGIYDSIRVLIADGSGGIAYMLSMEVASYPYSTVMTVDDINMDGYDDIMTFNANTSGPSSILSFKNNGGTSFSANTQINIAAAVTDVELKDTDGDGDKDIFIASSAYYPPAYSDTSKAIVIQNTTPVSNSTFSFSQIYTHQFITNVELQAKGITAGDFNGDLLVDFAVCLDQTTTDLRMFINDGAGGYNISLIPIAVGAKTLSSADMNNDGDLDLVLTFGSGFSGYSYAYSNNGTGAFPIFTLFGNTSGYSTNVIADIDQDGIKDVLLCSNVNMMGTYLPAMPIFNNGSTSSFVTSSSGTTLCHGASSLLVFHWTNPALLNDPSPYYSWASGNDTLVYTADTSETVYVYGSAGGCSITDSIIIIANPAPNVELGSDQTGCLTAVNAGVILEPNTLYSWSSNPPGFSSGSPSESFSNTGTPVTYYLAATYTVTGCSAIDSLVVNLAAIPNVNLGNDLATCSNFMPSINIGVTNDPSVTYSWTSNPPGFSSSNSMEVVAPSTQTLYYLSATHTVSGCSASDSISIWIKPNPTLNLIGSFMNYACGGDSIHLTDILVATGGTPPYVYDWWYGNGTVPDAGVNTVYFPSSAETFSVGVVDANGCQQSGGATVSFSIQYNSTVSTDLVGHVTTPLPADVTSGLVYAFNHQPGSAGLDTAAIVSLDLNGKYVFPGLDNDNYLIKVIANQSAYPLSVPTYYGNTFQWDSSLIVTHGCVQIDTADIQILEVPVVTGPGFISGYIIEQAGFGNARFGNGIHNPNIPFAPGGPLKGIDVKLGRNPGGGIQARTMSDSTGYYHFDSIPLGGYNIYVDIPNLPMDSTRNVVVAIGNENSVQNNYYADSASVYIVDTTFAIGIYSSEKIYDNHFSIFPNPAKDKLNLKFDISKTSDVSIELSNALGQTVNEVLIQNATSGEYTHSMDISLLNLKAGVYFISVINEGKKYTQRLVVVE